MQGLKELRLEGNPLEFPISQFSKESSTTRLFQFLKDVAAGTEKWPQIKLVTLGHGGVGKVHDHFFYPQQVDNSCTIYRFYV